jgi:2-oxoglutarate dehydrogenase E1 component
VHTEYRKPLVVFTPKKLLRYPKAVSSLNDMANGKFQEVLDDTSVSKKAVDTLVFCSGKVYYEILEQKEKLSAGDNMAVIRLEQLYPLPEKQIRAIIQSYNKNAKLIWAQEEPENMGAWSYMMRMLRDLNLDVVSLPASASPATGSPKVHEKRMKEMMSKLFAHSSVKA